MDLESYANSAGEATEELSREAGVENPSMTRHIGKIVALESQRRQNMAMLGGACREARKAGMSDEEIGGILGFRGRRARKKVRSLIRYEDRYLRNRD